MKYIELRAHGNKSDVISDTVDLGIFANDKADFSMFLKEEVNQLQIISNMINEIIIQNEEAFRNVHEQEIRI